MSLFAHVKARAAQWKDWLMAEFLRDRSWPMIRNRIAGFRNVALVA